SNRLFALRCPARSIPELEVLTLADHHRVALELRVQSQSRRQQDSPGGVGDYVLLESEQQALPPARFRVEAWEARHLRAHRFPLEGRINQHATVRVSGEDKRLSRVQQRRAMACRDSDAPFGVERDDRRSMKRRIHHMAICAT